MTFQDYARRLEIDEALDAVERGFVYRKTLRGACQWAATEVYGDASLAEALEALVLLDDVDPVHAFDDHSQPREAEDKDRLIGQQD